MNIDRVKATIRYSQDTGKGAWKSVEVGAEGSVDERERCHTALAQLYTELGRELKALWANGNGKTEAAPVVAAEPSKVLEPIPATTASNTARSSRGLRKRGGSGAVTKRRMESGAKSRKLLGPTGK